jgi:hypothetical protein
MSKRSVRQAQILNWKTFALRTLGVCFAVINFASAGALACSPPSERSIIYEHVPTDLDAPVIVEVTIVHRGPDVVDPSNGSQLAVMSAQVERVIKGRIDDGPLKIVTELGDCSRGFGVGSHGVVAGSLRRDSQGRAELVAIQRSNMRLWSKEFLQSQTNARASGRSDQ